MESDRLVTVKELAEILNITEDWIYHHHKELPFKVELPVGRQLRFSLQGIHKWIEEQQDARRRESVFTR